MENKIIGALDVACPFCGATANQKCRTRYGNPLDTVHNRRRQEVNKARYAEIMAMSKEDRDKRRAAIRAAVKREVAAETKPRGLLGWAQSLLKKVS
jgi:hypothetical protein